MGAGMYLLASREIKYATDHLDLESLAGQRGRKCMSAMSNLSIEDLTEREDTLKRREQELRNKLEALAKKENDFEKRVRLQEKEFKLREKKVTRKEEALTKSESASWMCERCDGPADHNPPTSPLIC